MLFPLVFEALLLKGERSDPVDHGIEPLVVDVIRHLARLPVLNEDCVELALPVRLLVFRARDKTRILRVIRSFLMKNDVGMMGGYISIDVLGVFLDPQ